MQLQRSVRIGLPRAVGVPRRPAGRVSSTYRRVEPSASPRGRRVLIRDRFTSTQGVTSAQRCVLFQGVDFFNVHNFYNNGILIRTVSAFSRRVFSSRVTATFVLFTLLLLSFSLQHHVWRLSSLVPALLPHSFSLLPSLALRLKTPETRSLLALNHCRCSSS